MRYDCGGCRGEGAHWRWCEKVVGRAAWLLGQLSQQCEDLGDRIGSNDPGAANHCYTASGLLRTRATEAKAAHMEREST